MSTSDQTEPLKVYWQPGCSSCLRTKEFLTRHNIAFISVNVLADQAAFDELALLGVRRVPIVRRGREWVDGQVLADIARIAGIPWRKQEGLSPATLCERIVTILDVAQHLLSQIPEEKLDSVFSQRPASYRQHALHIFRIVEAFLDLLENAKRLEFSAYANDIPAHIVTKGDLQAFGAGIAQRFAHWRDAREAECDWSAPADVYYGIQSRHEFLERTTWHSGQHTRQLQLVVETLGLRPHRALSQADIAGLPIPENVWDDKLTFG